jgi:hypothetical protein
MALSYQSAGVYVKEVDLSQVIASVATSIGAIVLASAKGPVDSWLVIWLWRWHCRS